MDGWMDEWMDRWMDGWMDGWMDRLNFFPNPPSTADPLETYEDLGVLLLSLFLLLL